MKSCRGCRKGSRRRVGSGSSMKRGTRKTGRAGVSARRAPGSRKGSRKPRVSTPVVGLPKPMTGKGKKLKSVFKKGRTLVGTVLDSGAKNASDPEMRAAMGIAGDLVSKKKERRKRGLKSGLAMAFKSI